MRVLDRINRKLMYMCTTYAYVCICQTDKDYMIVYTWICYHLSSLPWWFRLTHDCKQVVTYKRQEYSSVTISSRRRDIPSGSRFCFFRNMKSLVFLSLLFVTLCAAQVRMNLMDYWFLDIYEKVIYNMQKYEIHTNAL